MPEPAQKRGRSKQDYRTPPELLQAVRHRLHIEDFAMDLAASEANHVCPAFYSEGDDALAAHNTWVFPSGWCWLNPPFGHIEPWVEKATQESSKGARIAMLVPASVGANWWSEYVEFYAYQLFLQGRLTFVGCRTPYPKDCALLLYMPEWLTGNQVWYWRDRIDE